MKRWNQNIIISWIFFFYKFSILWREAAGLKWSIYRTLKVIWKRIEYFWKKCILKHFYTKIFSVFRFLIYSSENKIIFMDFKIVLNPIVQYIILEILGNGPAGLSLSAFLSGLIPFYNPESRHPNPAIDGRLSPEPAESLIDQVSTTVIYFSFQVYWFLEILLRKCTCFILNFIVLVFFFFLSLLSSKIALQLR